MISIIKEALYKFLAEDLGYTVYDGPYDESNREYPYLYLNMSNTVRERRKKDTVNDIISFKIDIFSLYDGEQEILDMEKTIFDNIDKLYDIDSISYIKQGSFRILDDKSEGTLKKHGILTYSFFVKGIEEIVEDNVDDDTSNEDNNTAS